jgi:hypothetical protein
MANERRGKDGTCNHNLIQFKIYGLYKEVMSNLYSNNFRHIMIFGHS